MKSLSQYINEANQPKYGTVLQSIEIDTSLSTSQLRAILKDGFEKAIERYKVIRVEAVAKANEEEDIRIKKKWDDTLKAAEEDIIDSIQYKPGILRRSPEKQRAWVDQKIQSLKWQLSKNYDYIAKHCEVEFDNEEITFGYHNDIYSDNGYISCKGTVGLSNVISDIIEDATEKDDFKNHLKSIQLVASNFTTKYPYIGVYPMFDDEFEDTLAKSVQKFSDFMSKEYSSGRYMGD